MERLHFLTRVTVTFAFLFICSFAAQAQTRTFVSGLGSDGNPCTRISPCRSFQRAHDVVNVGGEVIAVDSAGYGPVTITKSVSIIGDGVYAGINTSSGDGVTIATAGIKVNLRSLTIEGLGTATNGIQATGFAVLHIENCNVTGFTNIGINVFPATGGATKVFIKDSISRNNLFGLAVFNNGATSLIGTIEGTRTENNGGAGVITAGTGVTVTARKCLSSGNAGEGFISAASAVLNIENSVAANNNIGISTDSTVRVSNSVVTNNTVFGFSNNGGTFESRGNNTVAGNNGGGAQTSGTITPLTPL